MKWISIFPLVLLMSACSTVPRAYSPVIPGHNLSDPEFVAVLERCVTMVNDGVTSGFNENWVASSAVGVATGYGTGALVVASVGGAGLAETAIAASAAIVLMPVVGVAGAVIYSRQVRARREREVQDATGQCLREHGYAVQGWVLQPSASQGSRTSDPAETTLG